ncbi:MAG: hypothetical protein J6J93_00920, partial [Muribaculaceae bacterium]|nr:hypothetical protein [Muribaculaceae bacterium]
NRLLNLLTLTKTERLLDCSKKEKERKRLKNSVSFYIGKDNPSLSEGVKSFRYGQKIPPMVK